jgi:uncharacterized membrane-anchored protein YhcB (DUF1043 family)
MGKLQKVGISVALSLPLLTGLGSIITRAQTEMSVEEYLEKSVQQARQQKIQEALKTIQRGVDTHPEAPLLQYRLGSLKFEAEYKMDEVVEHFYNAASLSKKQGNDKQASEIMKKIGKLKEEQRYLQQQNKDIRDMM